MSKNELDQLMTRSDDELKNLSKQTLKSLDDHIFLKVEELKDSLFKLRETLGITKEQLDQIKKIIVESYELDERKNTLQKMILEAKE
jgi:DNA-binding transcriptional regulator YiaG